MTSPFSWIADEHSLSQACTRTAAAKIIALDTECIRERTYHPVPSLIQMASERGIFLLDAAAISDFKALHALLANPAITKVIHAAGQDHLILKQLGCPMEMPIFDTQIAAAFLNMGYQISYKALVEECLGISLKKDCTRSNWLRRPLSAEQQEYAANDVLHLLGLHRILNERLARDNRQDWFISESERILHASKRAVELKPEEMAIKVAGQGKLNREFQHKRLRALIVWRERKAQIADLPRRWLLSDRRLLALACLQNPSSAQALELITARSGNGARHRKTAAHPYEQWAGEVSAILTGIADDGRPAVRKTPSLEQKKQIDKIFQALKKSADEHNVDCSLIANRKQIVRLVTKGDREVRELLNSGWRKTVTRNHLRHCE